MTVEKIITKARRIIHDTEEPYRWGSDELRDALQDGINALHAIRPATRYVNGLLTDGVTLPAADAADQSFPIDVRFEEALVFYVCYKCYLDDDTDTANQALAESYLAKFNTKAQM